MESFIRKAIVCFSAVFALFFVSCADKESKYSTLLLNGSYSYLMCSADSDCADAESEAGHFQKLDDSSYRNLEKIAGRDGAYMWIKSEFQIPDALKHKTLGYVIPYLHFAEKVWLNGTYLGGYGEFPPDLVSAQYAVHFYALPEKILNQTGTNTILIKVFVIGKGSLSGKTFIAEVDKAKRFASDHSFFYSKVYMPFEGGLFCAFILFYILFAMQKKTKEYMSFALLNLFTLFFMAYFFAQELPWFAGLGLSFMVFIKFGLCFCSSCMVFFASSVMIHFTKLEETKKQLTVRLALFTAAVIITAIIPTYEGLMRICPLVIVLLLIQLSFGLYALVKALFKPEFRNNALILLVCFGSTFITGAADFILRVICKTNVLPHLTLFGWQGTVVMFLYVLCYRYSRVFKRNEYLNEKLEQEVASQTIELSKAKDDLEHQMERAKTDLEMAAIVQQKFLPEIAKPFAGWDTAVCYEPVSSVSGDFYDYYMQGGKLAGVSLFDVSGHGIAASLITMLAKATVLRLYTDGCKQGESVSKILEKVNYVLIKEKGNVDNYLTGLLLKIGAFHKNGTCSIELANAGHPEPLLFSAENNSASFLRFEDSSKQYGAIGIKGIEVSFPLISFDMKPGDILLLYTDGLVETMNAAREQFGKERVTDLLVKNSGKPAHEIIDVLLSELNRHAGSTAREDDVTLLVLKRERIEESKEEIEELDG